ncbi:MAG: AAA family ATPase [Armatimonadetes bacterium]|nr:AAA family ATPase [Armatimonadota bacterium]NIO74520.1 AAA family ATPase [Armatimonadota bacterium]NIO98349.1 AAA family ATPase [Armatimonadota bacterium]
MAGEKPGHVLLTGAPGCGKTTIIMGVLRLLRESRRPVFGFWTQEILQGGARRGFALETVSGNKGTLASVEWSGPPRVGRYGVKPEVMDRLVVPEIERAIKEADSTSGVVLVLDEIGKMELFSKAFQQAVISAFDSKAQVLATIIARPHPFADTLKKRRDVTLITVTPENRGGLSGQIAELLQVGSS